MKTWQVLMLARPEKVVRGAPMDNQAHPPLEDLERLALDKTTPSERLDLEQHLKGCTMCRPILEEAKGFAEQLAHLTASPTWPRERRKAIRYPVNEHTTVALCNPPEFVPIRGEVVNASTLGLLVSIPCSMHRGSQVYVQVENAAVFGTIRYCRNNARDTCDIGISIDQVVMRPGLTSVLDSRHRAPALPKSHRFAHAKPRKARARV